MIKQKNNHTIGERVKNRRLKLKMTQEDVAFVVKVTKQTIQKYENNIITNIPSDKIELLSKALNCSPAYLMGWEDDEDTKRFQAPIITEDVTEFPIIGEIAAGFENIAAEDWTGETIEIPNKYLKGYKKTDFFVLRVKGQSMYPIYQEDDVVLILKQSTVNQSGDIGVIVYGDECATLKKLEFIKGEDWLRMIPLNPEYVPRLIEGEDLEHCCVLGIPKLLIREIN